MPEPEHDMTSPELVPQAVPEAEATWPALSELAPATGGVVRGLRGGHGFVSRMAALGFTVGAEVEVTQNLGRGAIIVSVRGTEVALGRDEATNVQVQVTPIQGQATVPPGVVKVALDPVWGLMLLLGVLGIVFWLTYSKGDDDLALVQDALGHRDARTTRIYTTVKVDPRLIAPVKKAFGS